MIISTCALAAVCFGLGIWWLMRPSVQLDEQSYATTLALYRVCNQKSVEGLEQIEAMVDEAVSSSSAPDAGLAAIESIIEQARRDQWGNATRDCRLLLDSQVRR